MIRDEATASSHRSGHPGLKGGVTRRFGGITPTFPAPAFVAVYVFLLLCIPSQLIVRPIGAPGTPANLWGILALLWWVVATIGGQNPVKGFTPARVTLGLVAAAVLISYAAGNAAGWFAPADIRQVTDESWTLVVVQPDDLSAKMISAADRGLLSFAGWCGIFLITAEALRNWRDIEFVVKWIARFGAFVASLGIVQYFSGVDIASFFVIPGLSANSEFGTVVSRSVLNRVSSTAVHPIEFGVVMAAIFFLALHRGLFGNGSILRWVPAVLIGMSLPMSVSRSAILALALAGILVLVCWPSRWRFPALLLLPVAVVGLRVVAPGLVGTLQSLFLNLGNDPSISGRTDDYAPVLSLYSENPIFGRGLFTFVPRYYRILDNQFLMFLVELGVFGLLLVVFMIVIGVASALGAMRRSIDPRSRNLALSIAAGLVGVFFSYATFDAWGFPMVAGMSFLLLGLAAAARRASLNEDCVPDRQPKTELPR